MGKRTWFTSRQKQFLNLVHKDQKFQTRFYLTGGTALSACYFNHRESNDLDFFTKQEIKPEYILNFLLSLKKDLNYQVIKKINTNINGYVLIWSDKSKLKLDFIYYAFKQLKKPEMINGLAVDSLSDIAANKLETILLRSEARDYIDLYFIIKSKKLTFLKVLKLHKQKFEVEIKKLEIVNALLKVNEAVNYPQMKVKFSQKDLIKFFEKEARSLGKNIFK